jgi:hypothetical protein
MRVADIIEGHRYTNDAMGDNYFRQVEMIVDAPKRPGGKVVAWSTDGFNVKRKENGRVEAKMRGKCGIETFAKWASRDLTE